MFTPTNPEHERIRAEAILRSFTEYDKAVEVFAPGSQGKASECADDDRRHNSRSIMRIFNAIRLSRRVVVEEPVQQPVYSPRQITTPGCS